MLGGYGQHFSIGLGLAWAPIWALTVVLAVAPEVRAGASSLEFASLVRAGGGASGLDGCLDLAFSPDSKHLYVAAVDDDAVVALSYDSSTSALTYIDAYEDEADGGAFLNGAQAVAVSPDGAHVYVAAPLDDAVSVFARDSASGELTFVAAVVVGIDAPLGLDGVLALGVAVDGSLVFTGSKVDRALTVFARDSATGALTHVETISDFSAGVNEIVQFLPSADGAHLYVTNRSATNQIVAFRILAGGTLERIDGYASTSNSLATMVLTPDGLRLYAMTADRVFLYDRDPVTGALTQVGAQFDSFGLLALDPSGQTLYVTDFSFPVDRLRVLDVDGDTGGLSEVVTYADSDPGFEQITEFYRSVVAPDGSGLVSVAPAHSVVASFARDTDDGTLTAAPGLRDHLGGRAIESVRSIAVSPDGRHLYAVSTEEDSLVVFGRDAGDGSLTFVESHLRGFDGTGSLAEPGDVVVSPGGEHVYVLATGAGVDVIVYDRDAVTGTLSVASVFDAFGFFAAQRHAMVMTPDGRFLYLRSDFFDFPDVAVLERDPATGALTFVELFEVSSLFEIRDFAVSPDGAQLYASGRFTTTNGGPSGVAAFDIDALSGQLTPAGTLSQDQAGDLALSDPRSLAVSSDGRQVYAGSRDGLAVAVLDRDVGTGALSFATSYVDGDNAITGLDLPVDLALTPDDSMLFAASASAGDALVSFRRSSNGRLGFVETLRDDVASVDGLAEPSRVAVSPDNRHVYVAASEDDAISVFSVVPNACPVLPAAGCLRPSKAAKAKLKIRDESDDDRDRLQWQWRKGPAVDLADFGALNEGGSLVTCVYESSPPSAASPQLVWSATARGADVCATIRPGVDRLCWKVSSSKLRYKDGAATPDGVAEVKLKAGSAGRAAVELKGEGEVLEPPSLPLQASVVVQTHSTETGVCWEATFTEPKRNDADRYEAKAD